MIYEDNLYKLPSPFKLDIKKTSHDYLTWKLIKLINSLMKTLVPSIESVQPRRQKKQTT